VCQAATTRERLCEVLADCGALDEGLVHNKVLEPWPRSGPPDVSDLQNPALSGERGHRVAHERVLPPERHAVPAYRVFSRRAVRAGYAARVDVARSVMARMARNTKLPKGVEVDGQRVLVDASLTVVDVAPGLVLLTRARGGTAALQHSHGNTTGWAACKCSAGGSCKIVTQTSPDGSKISIRCESGTCKGDCGVDAGVWLKRASLARAILAEVAKPSG
jgi:hypothetical protein